ncbi:MAG: hypothetical protein ACO3A4_08160 [Silvanigrellaceae bacterium]
MTKPKKPLRGLFASTEAPAPTPSRPAIPVPPSRKERPSFPSTPQKPKTPPERLAPPPRIKTPAPMMIMEQAEPAPVTIIETVQPVVVPVIASPENKIMSIQYNFDSMRDTRDSWQELDYAHFLRKLDAVQTEAFILKGKLLSEAKIRFFETNKVGWAEFCEMKLDMNYTTANQYIRVATEFDVTSHQHPDFGFEHFKALLPLSIEQRSDFLNSNGPVSVKLIRQRVREIITARPSDISGATTTKPLKQSLRFIKMLEAIKAEVLTHGESFQGLTQPQRWQVTAACQNIAAHLNHLAQVLSSDPIQGRALPGATSRAGAFATADGVATMQDASTILEPIGNSN